MRRIWGPEGRKAVEGEPDAERFPGAVDVGEAKQPADVGDRPRRRAAGWIGRRDDMALALAGDAEEGRRAGDAAQLARPIDLAMLHAPTPPLGLVG
ncbi:MAG TPA: hypothetical protein VKC63_06315 [Solirubrobacterales bacterium]|nr:hypothetical protein [Solirubrobacterales bacterium]